MDSRVRRAASTTRGPAEGTAVLDEAFATRDVRADPDGRFSTAPSCSWAGPVASERGRLRGSSATGRTDGPGALQVSRATEGALGG